jgi:membrane carboxypeptidase/penicillin-binding protein
MNYMGKTLKGTPEMVQRNPDGIAVVRVNENGLQSPDGKPEFFFRENVPPVQVQVDPAVRTAEEVKNQLF